MRHTTFLLALMALAGSIALLQTVSAFGSSQRSSTASAEVMDPLQVAILMELTVTYPALLTLSSGAWSNQSLSDRGCTSGVAFISACNGSGWVTNMAFDSSNLAGPFPEGLSKMEALESLDFSWDTITGTLPASWSSLTSLQSLRVYQSSVLGSIPASWSALESLTSLVLTWSLNAPVTSWANGCLPNSTLNLVQFFNLNLGTTAALPADLFTTSTISNIVLSNITFSGNLSPLFSNVHAPLSIFYLIANPIVADLPATPSLPTDLSGLPLTSIDLGNLPVQGPLPTTLPDSLVHLSLSNLPRLASTLSTGILTGRSDFTEIFLTQLPLVTGTIPSIGFNLNPVALDRMGLTGTFPVSLLSVSTLRRLQITNMPNMTRYPLPEAPEDCSIISLNASNINLEGTFPYSWSERCGMGTLDLSYNYMNGTFEWARRAAMSTLVLSHNNFVGSFPDILAGGISEIFDIGYNQFNGTLSATMLQSGHTDVFRIDHNDFDLCAIINNTELGGFSTRSGCSVDPQDNLACECYLQGFPSYCWDPTSVCQPIAPPDSPSPSATPQGPISSPDSLSPSATPQVPAQVPTQVPIHGPVRAPTGSATVAARTSTVSSLLAAALVLVAVAY